MNNQTTENISLRIPRLVLMLGALLAISASVVFRVCAQSAVAITDTSTPVALSSNNTNSSSTYVLNSDASVSILQNAGFGSGGCAPITNLNGGHLANSAVSFDSTTNRLYAVMEEDSSTGGGLGTFVTFVTISGGTCTNGPSAQISTLTFGNIELGVDPGEGNVYVLQATEGGSQDILFVLSPANFSDYVLTANPTLPLLNPPQVSLDYSASYGPIVVDTTTHRVYINDFGASQGLPGLTASPGFFVYDPGNSATVSKNVQHVYGYVTSPPIPPTTLPATPLSAQALFVHSGDLILANQNTSAASGGSLTAQTAPYTILHTTASGFSFFTNTQAGPAGTSSSVSIYPGTNGISVISTANGATVLGYTATGGADIDTTNGYIYRFAYNATSPSAFSLKATQDTGALIRYNLATQVESQLTSASGSPLANVYPNPDIAPWSQITFNAANNNVTLANPTALGVSNNLACTEVSLDQVLGGGTTYQIFGEAALNFSSGYVYDTITVYPTTTLYYAEPPPSCAAPTLVISPTVLPAGVAGQLYSQQFTVTSGAVGGVSFTPVLIASGIELSSNGSFSGTPLQVGTFPVPVSVIDSAGDVGNENIPVTIGCPAITAGPSPLPTGIVGVPYSFSFTQTGGIGNVTYQAFGPFPPGINLTAMATGLTGTPTTAGTWPIGIQATDSNKCQSPNNIQTLTVVGPRFAISPIPATGLANCPAPGPGFPITVAPVVPYNTVSSYQINVTIFNSGNVSAIANLEFANLGGFPVVNAPLPGDPVILGSPGALLAPGQCVSLTFYYPTAYFTAPAPLAGYTLANIPQVLKLAGTYNIVTPGSGTGPTTNWSLTGKPIFLSGNLCCTNTTGVLSGETSYNPNAGGPIGVGGNP